MKNRIANGTSGFLLEAHERARKPYVEDLEQDAIDRLRAAVPENILDALDSYVCGRTAPGSFTRAVIENDLRRAVFTADPMSFTALRSIVTYVHNCLPGWSHGSPETVKKWLAGREAE